MKTEHVELLGGAICSSAAAQFAFLVPHGAELCVPFLSSAKWNKLLLKGSDKGDVPADPGSASVVIK